MRFSRLTGLGVCLLSSLILDAQSNARSPDKKFHSPAAQPSADQSLADQSPAAAEDPTRFVDPFIGTRGDGNTLPGATLPFGMVKLGPDCDLVHANAGYVPGKPIIGFSHTHVSGTGGGPKYGNILVMPTTGPLDIRDHVSPASDESASPGYYAVGLKRYGIRAELTICPRVGLHRYRFNSSGQANLLFDLGSFLGQGYGYGEGQELVGSEVRFLSPRELEGYSRVRGGWNKGDAYTVYFYAVVEKAAGEFGTWKKGIVHRGNMSEFDSGDPTGAYLTWPVKKDETILLKVGISYISTLKARENLEEEAPGWDFDAYRRSAGSTWDKTLEKISITTDDLVAKKIFYTALYHACQMPVDKTGENPRWTSAAPNEDDFYAIWDTFRTLNPLYTLIDPARERDIIRSLIDIYLHDGYMPDARSGNCNGRTQGGSNADVLIAEAWAKGIDSIDYDQALMAMQKDAEVPPGGDGLDDNHKEGRSGISDFKTLGYVSTRFGASASRTLEYAYDDFCISELAKGLGRMDLADKYKTRSAYWKNLWKPITDHGATGFIMPRSDKGYWAGSDSTPAWDRKEPFTVLSAGSWTDPFYESCSWEYSFYVPQDMPGLIAKCGGKRAFVSRLDTFFKNGYYNVGNEPGFLTPVLYHWAGRPDRSAVQVSRIRRQYYHDAADGLPGNDDAGAMSSLYIFHALGFFPVAGKDIYLLTTPLFPRLSIKLENGREITLIADHVSPENIYIQSVLWNGKPYAKSWFRHADIRNGAVIECVMGNRPSDWGEQELPE